MNPYPLIPRSHLQSMGLQGAQRSHVAKKQMSPISLDWLVDYAAKTAEGMQPPGSKGTAKPRNIGTAKPRKPATGLRGRMLKVRNLQGSIFRIATWSTCTAS